MQSILGATRDDPSREKKVVYCPNCHSDTTHERLELPFNGTSWRCMTCRKLNVDLYTETRSDEPSVTARGRKCPTVKFFVIFGICVMVFSVADMLLGIPALGIPKTFVHDAIYLTGGAILWHHFRK